MPQIVLTPDQLQALGEGWDRAELLGPGGELVAIASRFAEAELLAEAQRRRANPMPTIPGERVAAHLQALQAEWDRSGGFDREYMHRFLQQLRAEDQS